LCWTIESSFGLISLLDILVVAAIFFMISLALRGTQAMPLLRGMIILFMITGLIALLFPFVAFRWLLGNTVTIAFVALPIIFQPELRRALERLGRAGLGVNRRTIEEALRLKVIDAICAAAGRLSERRQGALIVLERETSLQEYVDTGVLVDSEVSPQLLLTIFWPKTELHDGAVILRQGRIASAGSVLPLSSSRQLTDRKLGTRHRAAIGISEVSDGICVVVSEETGQISVTNSGRMIRRLDAGRLRTILLAFYGEQKPALAGGPFGGFVSALRTVFLGQGERLAGD
jgi:diadenylate cyclase